MLDAGAMFLCMGDEHSIGVLGGAAVASPRAIQAQEGLE